MSKSRRAIIAHHEAGHAVIDHQLGYKVRRIEINDKRGRTDIKLRKRRRRLSEDERAMRFERAMLADLAGPYAQKRFAPGSDWRIDEITSRIYAMHGEGEVAKAYRRYIEIRAEALVEQHWQKIAAVAAYLFKHGVFTGDIRTLFPQPRRSI